MMIDLLKKLESFDVGAWLGLITLAMQLNQMEDFEVSSESLKLIRNEKRYLKIHAIENGFVFSLIRADEIHGQDVMVLPTPHTIN